MAYEIVALQQPLGQRRREKYYLHGQDAGLLYMTIAGVAHRLNHCEEPAYSTIQEAGKLVIGGVERSVRPLDNKELRELELLVKDTLVAR